MGSRLRRLAVAAVLIIAQPASAAAVVTIGSVTGRVGEPISLPVTMNSGQVDVVSLGVLFELGPKARFLQKDDGRPECAAGPLIRSEDASFAFRPVGCRPAVDCSGINAIIFPLDESPPRIPNGELLFACQIEPLATGPSSVPCEATATDRDGSFLTPDCESGFIFGEPGIPPNTPTASPTAIATRHAACAGDCDGDSVVSIDELIRGVRIALGEVEASACPAVDQSGNGSVEISELIAAVTRALGSCTSPAATPTATPTTAPISACPFPLSADFGNEACVYEGYLTGPTCRIENLRSVVSGDGEFLFIFLDTDPELVIAAEPFGGESGRRNATITAWAEDPFEDFIDLGGRVTLSADFPRIDVAPTRAPFLIEGCEFEFYRADFVGLLHGNAAQRNPRAMSPLR